MSSNIPVAFITGAARRIGAAIAKYLHENGFDIIVHYNTSELEAQELVATLNSLRADSAICIKCDLLANDLTKTCDYLLEQTLLWRKHLNLLVHNASIFMSTNYVSSDHDNWEQIFKLNTKVPFFLSNAFYPLLKKTAGSIINITDTHAQNALKNHSIYCQSKAALMMQTKTLATDFAPFVRVNAVAPGAILWPENNNKLQPLQQQKIIEKTLLKKHGNPLYIAKGVFALADNPFITGQTLNVDGGR